MDTTPAQPDPADASPAGDEVAEFYAEGWSLLVHALDGFGLQAAVVPVPGGAVLEVVNPMGERLEVTDTNRPLPADPADVGTYTVFDPRRDQTSTYRADQPMGDLVARWARLLA